MFSRKLCSIAAILGMSCVVAFGSSAVAREEPAPVEQETETDTVPPAPEEEIDAGLPQGDEAGFGDGGEAMPGSSPTPQEGRQEGERQPETDNDR